MKAPLITILMFVLSTYSFGQSTKDPLDCSYKRKYSPEQRLKFYPFNISDSIRLVSFRCHNTNLAISKDGFIKDSLIESTTLNKSDINKLTDILYNNFDRGKTNIGTMTLCFFPRNAILFFDKQGKLVEYILVCFQCDRQETSSEEVETGDDCNQKIKKLLAFFKAKALKFGTNKDIDAYPGETCMEEGIVHPPK